MLHRLLGEEGKALIEASATVASRRYQRDGVFSVMVEGSVVASTRTLDAALLLFGVAHYVFNQKVARSSRYTMWLLAKELMNLAAVPRTSAGTWQNFSAR